MNSFSLGEGRGAHEERARVKSGNSRLYFEREGKKSRGGNFFSTKLRKDFKGEGNAIPQLGGGRCRIL